MPKKQRRVSFNVPEKKHEEEEEENHGITIAIDEDPIDEEVETIEATGINHSQSDEKDSGSSDASSSEEERKTRRRRKRKHRAEKTKTENTKLGRGVGSGDETIPSKDSGNARDLRSDDHGTSESESDTDSDADSNGGPAIDPTEGSYADSDLGTDGNDSSDDDSDEESQEEGSKPEETSAPEKGEKPPSPISTFSEMGLDARVERVIEKMGWQKPTPVQSAVIPTATAGRDVLVSAPTGSGKTAAYAVPIVQHFCQNKTSTASGIRCVILVPTRELVHQVSKIMKQMCKYIEGIRIGSVASKEVKKGNRDGVLNKTSDIIVATPSALLAATSKEQKNAFGNVEFVVVDEADLVLNYGYEVDARALLSQIPNSSQSILLSATLEADGMDAFRKVVLRRPLTIKVTADDNGLDEDRTGATHYYARLKNHKDRYLVSYAMLRLNVICGKVLIFVNHINTAFRLKLFLDQFKLRSAVLNSELPANSRIHCVEQFNAGIFEILIATDESKQQKPGSEVGNRSKKVSKKRRRAERDEEFGLSRGVDFQDVAAVFNFDIPETSARYTHRAGRTARAGKTGTVLTLVCHDKEELAVLDMGRNIGVHIGPLAFRMDQIESLRYRVESSLRLVTDTAVHGARLADVHREIINSETLKDYFEDNPQDLDALEHSLSLAKKIPEHLGHIPSYLLPPTLRRNANNELKGKRFNRKRPKHSGSRRNTDQRNRADPLKNFSTSGVPGSSRHRYRTKHGIKTKKKDLGRAVKKRRRTY